MKILIRSNLFFELNSFKREVLDKLASLSAFFLEELFNGTISYSWLSIQKKYEKGITFNPIFLSFENSKVALNTKLNSLKLIISIEHISKEFNSKDSNF